MLLSLSTRESDAEVVLNKLVARFQDFYDSKTRIDILGADVRQILSPFPRRGKSSAKADEVRWPPLPYHFLWQYSGIGARLKRFSTDYSSCLGFGVTCMTVRPAWKVGSSRTIGMVKAAVERAIAGKNQEGAHRRVQ